MGVSVYRHKVLAFVVSAGFAGLAGALYAYFRQYIAPEAFNFSTSIEFLLAVAMGGRKSDKHSTPLTEVKRYFTRAGFRFVKDFARTPLIHTLHVAVFERAPKAAK